MGVCGWDGGGRASKGLLQLRTKRDSTRAWPRLGATVRTSFSSMTANMLVESKPCWIREEMVLSDRPSFRNRARNSGSAILFGSTGAGGGGRGVVTGAGGGGAGVRTACTGAGGTTPGGCTAAGGGGSGAGATIGRLGSEAGMTGGGGRGCCRCSC